MEPINLSEYETLAQTKLEASVWDYYQGGSEDEVTLRANRTAFERIRLRPRMLVDVSTCDLRTSVLGTQVSMPILVAPTAYHCMAHPDGECATVQGAGTSRTLFTASTAATRTLEDIAQAASGPLWFQLYLNANLRISEALVKRAEAAGYRAILLTVDLPRLGNRERDKRYNVIMPPEPWREANFIKEYPQEVPEEQESLFEIMKNRWDSSNLTWGILDWLRSVTPLPIMLKGILTAEDAALAVAHNVAGIVVSNHGGRQLDGALASIEALPEVVEAVAGRCEVYLDGGIRRGSDVLKALALGARAVLVGRPTLWGLTVNGADGVHQVLEILRTELDRAMALSGRPTIASIDRSLVRFV